MKKLLMCAFLVCSLTACGGSGYGSGTQVGVGVGITPGGGTPVTPPADATVSLSVTNDDQVDYALWIQWQDNLGNLNQDFVAILPAAQPGNPSQVFQDVSVISGFPYTLLLLDTSGSLWDSISLGTLNSGDILPVNLTVLGAAFLAS
jgi:hypothetical protein